MLNRNAYSNAYQETDDKINFLKFGLLNEYGEERERLNTKYNENIIIKRKCLTRLKKHN